MQNLGRKISLTLVIVFQAPVSTKAMLWSFAEPRLKILAFGRIDLDRVAPRSAVADPQGQAR
jgi:hypothetical protein